MTEPNKSLCNSSADQAEFMLAGDQTVRQYNEEQLILYIGLIKEEYEEVIDAFIRTSKPELLKELNDLKVVVEGAILSLTAYPETSWRAVHSNNMLKVANPPVKDPETGKIQKSPEAIAGKVAMMDALTILVDD